MSEPFKVVLADPGWQYDQPLKMSDGVKRSSKSQYRTMTVQEICDLYQTSIVGHGGRRGYSLERPATLAGHPIDATAILALWITAPLLLEGVHLRVCNAWGFAPKQIVPWIKGRLAIVNTPSAPEGDPNREWSQRARLIIQPGMGALTRVCTEYLVLATRGQYTKLVKSHAENGLLLAEEDALIVAPKSTHSRKPEQQYALLEKLFPGPYLELFPGPDRPARDGWTRWGDHMAPATSEEEPALPLESPIDALSIARRIREELQLAAAECDASFASKLVAANANELDDGRRMRRTRAKHTAAVEECLKLFRRLDSPDDDAKTNHRRQMLLTAEIQCLSLAEQKAYYKAIRPIIDERHAERQRQALQQEPLPEPPVSYS